LPEEGGSATSDATLVGGTPSDWEELFFDSSKTMVAKAGSSVDGIGRGDKSGGVDEVDDDEEEVEGHAS
jgi:hypothetical protein